jgi:predicted nucleic acid-binding protein
MPHATRRPRDMPEVVLDASALVDLLLGNEIGAAVQRRIARHTLHAPAHVDAEVLSASGRLQRADVIGDDDVESMLLRLVAAPIRKHPVAGLLLGAWSRRHRLRLADALYVELALSRGLQLISTDRRLGSVSLVEVIEV